MIVDNAAGSPAPESRSRTRSHVYIVNNTIANNDSLATAGEAFAPGSPSQSTPQAGAGVVTRSNSACSCRPASPGGSPLFSNPADFSNNIIWHNRQFFFWEWTPSPAALPVTRAASATYGLCPDVSGAALNCPGGNTVVYSDAGVAGGGRSSRSDNLGVEHVDGTIPDPTNTTQRIQLSSQSTSTARARPSSSPKITTAIQTPAAFDEGGNYHPSQLRAAVALQRRGAQRRRSRDGLFGDYHILNTGGRRSHSGSDFTLTYPALEVDFDMQARPNGG